MQSVSSRIWTRVAVSISYDDNNYTTGKCQIHPYVLWKRGFPTFSKGIGSKVNVTARLKFELACSNVTVQYVSQETTTRLPTTTAGCPL